MTRNKPPVADVESLSQRLGNLSNGRDEMNLCELPFATLSERSNGHRTLKFQVEEFDHQLGQIVERSLTVIGDPEHGLPTEKDEEIYLGLLKYSSDYNGFAEPEVRFCRSDLFELMDWPGSKWSYDRLTKGMYRLAGVRLHYQNLWRDNREKQWRDQGAFSILDSFEFRDSRHSENGSFLEQSSKFRWGSVLFESFDSGYLKKIDYGLARELSPTARRLYRYLDKHFHPPHKTRITINLARLAYQHIGISQGIELDKVRKRYIGSAAQELESAGYLQPSDDNRFEKVRRGVWNVSFTLAQNSQEKKSPEPDSESKLLSNELSRRGVSSAKVLTILSNYKMCHIEQALRAMDEQVKNGIAIRSPDRWLSKALRDGFRASPGIERTAKRPELQVYRSQRRRTG